MLPRVAATCRRRWDEDAERERRWFALGVAGSPSSERCFAAVRQKLIPKPWLAHVLGACERVRIELAREGEVLESSWGRPAKPRKKTSPSKAS